jgi:integrase
MCKLAMIHDLLDSNPARDTVKITAAPKEKVRALTPAEVEALSDGMASDRRGLELDLPDLVEWMLGTGCRIGEACAARLSALEAEVGVWEINATAVRVKGQGMTIQERPKTAAGWRKLALPPYCSDLIARRRAEERISAVEDLGLLFGAPFAKTVRDPSNTAGDLRRMLDRLGFPWVTSHVFRKTVATRLDEAGLSAKTVADVLGHARPSMTLDVYMGRNVVSADAARILDR